MDGKIINNSFDFIFAWLAGEIATMTMNEMQPTSIRVWQPENPSVAA